MNWTGRDRVPMNLDDPAWWENLAHEQWAERVGRLIGCLFGLIILVAAAYLGLATRR